MVTALTTIPQPVPLFSLAIPSHNARIIHGPSLFLRIYVVNTNSGLAISTLVAQVICSLVVRVLFFFQKVRPLSYLCGGEPPWLWRRCPLCRGRPSALGAPVRCGVFVHENVARRAGNSVDSMSWAGVWERV